MRLLRGLGLGLESTLALGLWELRGRMRESLGCREGYDPCGHPLLVTRVRLSDTTRAERFRSALRSGLEPGTGGISHDAYTPTALTLSV